MRLLIFGLAVALAGSAAKAAGPFALTSADFKHKGTLSNAQVYNGAGCTGRNISPALAWTNVPAETKSFAVTVFDPDAATGSGWWHWVVFNIPANARTLPAGAGDPAAGKTPPGSIQSRTDFGRPGYGGPCPPPGDRPHRYIFTVHALNVAQLDLDENAPAAMVSMSINARQIAKASLQATYGRR